jgi:hypothetical protein
MPVQSITSRFTLICARDIFVIAQNGPPSRKVVAMAVKLIRQKVSRPAMLGGGGGQKYISETQMERLS